MRRGPAIDADDILFEEVGLFGGGPGKAGGNEQDMCYLPGKSMKDIEREVLEKALKRNGGNRDATSEELGIARSTVFARIKDWGIDIPGAGAGGRHPSGGT